jgi:hypothetical protein
VFLSSSVRRVESRPKTVYRDPESWVAVPVPSVGVPRAVVEAARDRIKHNVRSSRASGRVWELDRGVLRCGDCGWQMVPRTTPDRGRPRFYYVCSSYSKRAERCPAAKHYRAEKPEALVAIKRTNWFGDVEKLETYVEERQSGASCSLATPTPKLEHSTSVSQSWIV